MYDAAADMASNNVDGTAWMDQILLFFYLFCFSWG